MKYDIHKTYCSSQYLNLGSTGLELAHQAKLSNQFESCYCVGSNSSFKHQGTINQKRQSKEKGKAEKKVFLLQNCLCPACIKQYLPQYSRMLATHFPYMCSFEDMHPTYPHFNNMFNFLCSLYQLCLNLSVVLRMISMVHIVCR